MKKLSAYLLLLSLLIISVSACSHTGDTSSTPATTYLEVQFRADAGAGNVTLDWQMLQSATTYNIYWIEDASGAYNADNKPSSATMKASTTNVTGRKSATYTVSGLTNGTQYWFAISAVQGSVESDLSSAINATPTSPAPPTAPENVRANAQDAAVTVTWTPVTNADHYNIYCWFLEGANTTINSGTADPITVSGQSSDSYIVSSVTWLAGSINGESIAGPGNLQNGMTYQFYVQAVDASNVESNPSFNYSATPSANPPPFAPDITSVVAGNQSITVYWDPVAASPTVTSYNIYIGEAKGVTKSTGQVTSITDLTPPLYGTASTLQNGKTYYIVVTAVNTNGESAESAEWWATPESGGGTSGVIMWMSGSIEIYAH